MNPKPAAAPRTLHGLTLVEMLVTVTVLAILLAIVVPSIQTTLDRRRLIGAADNLLTDLRYAQSESVKRNEVFVMSLTQGTAWRYSILGPTGSNFASKTVTSSDYSGTSLTAGANAVTFDPKRATIALSGSSSTIAEITSARSQKLRVDITTGSGLSLCTSTALSGYPSC